MKKETWGNRKNSMTHDVIIHAEIGRKYVYLTRERNKQLWKTVRVLKEKYQKCKTFEEVDELYLNSI
ncbi:MAG TPA: hypothetical protein ENG63_09750 [Candidatus Desulfofervidus auxilii]|uniref:Uncharacterized protein n=1 Tax=Desulfofervidus auxilii TaxID=1621989 RepID=A0A7C0U3Q9_DESA2|nr:hypothetical protein [Candidatus Desulfofervidus auxilii]